MKAGTQWSLSGEGRNSVVSQWGRPDCLGKTQGHRQLKGGLSGLSDLTPEQSCEQCGPVSEACSSDAMHAREEFISVLLFFVH